MEKIKALSKIKTIVIFLLFTLASITHSAYSQNEDSTKSSNHFGGAVSVTNNGISLIPSFSLGKPAVRFDLKVGGRFSFEPQFRFALEGKPWSFIYGLRYQLIKSKKFNLKIGVNPVLTFRRIPTIINGVTEELVVSKRYLAGVLAPNYSITKNISIGLYYINSHGFDIGVTKQINFLTFNTNISNIRLFKDYYLGLQPQVYYLKTDDKDGFYFNSPFSFRKSNFPLSIHSIINKAIKSEIITISDFVWNISLVYSFGNEYRKID